MSEELWVKWILNNEIDENESKWIVTYVTVHIYNTCTGNHGN